MKIHRSIFIFFLAAACASVLPLWPALRENSAEEEILYEAELESEDIEEVSEEIKVEELKMFNFEFESDRQPRQYRLYFKARMDFKYVSGANHALALKVNEKEIGVDKLINKPDFFTSKRVSSGTMMFSRKAFVVFMAPDFDPIPEDVIYRPLEFDESQPFEFVFDISEYVVKGKNTVTLKNTTQPDEKYRYILHLKDMRIDVLKAAPNKKEDQPIIKKGRY